MFKCFVFQKPESPGQLFFFSSSKCKVISICNGDVPTKTGLCPAQPAEQQAASFRSQLAERHRVDMASKAGQWRDIHWF